MNLLTDELFRVVTAGKSTNLSLPGLLEALSHDQVDALEGVQRHQVDILHIFLCYLAGSVLVRAGENEPTHASDFWLDGLRALVGRGDDLAWELVVADPTEPAFMQPPTSNKKVFEIEYKPKAETSDGIDMLQAAKNHDIKAARAIDCDLEAWTLALIAHQTGSGFFGRGNYGIARMNGGFGSRVCVSWQGGNRRLGTRFSKDTRVLLEHRKDLLTNPYPYTDRGLTCLWTEAWDGKTSLSLSNLDPFFIEVSRRIRLRDQGRIRVFGATSKVARIAAQGLKGNLGDPWTPIKISTSSALTPSANGWHPALLRDLIFRDDYKLTPMQIPSVDARSGWFCANVLVRGEGATDGFHEVSIRIPGRATPFLFGSGVKRDRLAELSKLGLDMAGALQNKCLRPALYALMEGGPESVVFGKREITDWVSSQSRPFFNSWSALYFDWLWSTLDVEDNIMALQPWLVSLKSIAVDVLEAAFHNCPTRRGRGYRAITRANGIFFGGLYKNFSEYLEENR